jgi:hypothetical protein
MHPPAQATRTLSETRAIEAAMDIWANVIFMRLHGSAAGLSIDLVL